MLRILGRLGEVGGGGGAGRSRARLVLLAMLTAGLFAGCDSGRLVEAACREDAHCGDGYLCENFVCVADDVKSCDVVTEGLPILQASPHAVSFGALDTEEATQRIALHNIGNCTLTLFEAQLSGAAGSPFSCDLCGGKFPLEIFPGRHRDLSLSFKAKDVGVVSDAVRILSDDGEFPDLQLPISVDFRGVPRLAAAPSPVQFGYVAQGRGVARRVSLTNQGTGVADLEVLGASISPAGDPNFSLNTPLEKPVTLRPVKTFGNSLLGLEVEYHPRASARHTAQLLLSTSKGDVVVPLEGTAESPAKLVLSNPSLDLGQVPLGGSKSTTLTLTNQGGAPLVVTHQWGGLRPSTDLSAAPSGLPPIASGAYTQMQVTFTATALGPVNGVLVLTTNDPVQPSVNVPVTAEGIPGLLPEVVKVEMSFDNGADNLFDNDLRNVDLALEHPFGFVCSKATPKPTNWGAYGNPSWLSFGPKEEPERVVLPDVTQDGVFRVMLQYQEDCSAIPTELLAGLLGISVEALIDYLTGGVGPVNAKDVQELIKKLCINRVESNVVIRVFVNGVPKVEKTVQLRAKGDTTYPVEIVRTGGTFTVR